MALIAALGIAAETAVTDHASRVAACRKVKSEAMAALEPLGIRAHGGLKHALDHVLNFAVPGIDSEALIVALKDLVAVSNGSACTSSSYTASHVIRAMGYSENEANEALRFSWCHLTPEVDWEAVAARIARLR